MATGADGVSVRELTVVEVAGEPALRRLSTREEPVPAAGDLPAGTLVVTQLEYAVPLPGTDSLLLLAFSTPVEALAEPLVTLFDVIAHEPALGPLVTLAPPDITVDHSPLWVHATSADDVDAWSVPAAEDLWAIADRPPADGDVERLASRLALLAEAAFATECFGAFLLCPDPARGPIAVVRLSGATFPAGTSLDDLVEEFLLPDEHHLVPPQVELATGRGLAQVRLRQRAWTDDTRTVADYLSWLLPFQGDDGGTAWLLSVSFPDPRDADRWLDELDALAAGVQLQPG
jgi:hypothetical protein